MKKKIMGFLDFAKKKKDWVCCKYSCYLYILQMGR